MPAWIWLVVIFAAGVVVGSVFPWLRRRYGRVENGPVGAPP